MADTVKLLVADDSLTIQKVIRLALSNEGYDIQTVSGGNEALETIPLFRPDVVLVDISLPELSAAELVKKSNEDSELEPPKFILMASSYDEIDETKISKIKFDGRLTKPFDPAHLRQVIQSAIGASKRQTKPPKKATQSNDALKDLPLTPPPPPPMPEEDFSKEFESDATSEAMIPPPPPPPHLATKDPSSVSFSDHVEDVSKPPPLPEQNPESQQHLSEDQVSRVTPPPPPPVAPPSLSQVSEETTQPHLSNDLWSAEEIRDQEMDTRESQTPSGVESKENADDIKELTEETLKMTGVDEFEWAVQEYALKPPGGNPNSVEPRIEQNKQPTPPPPPHEAINPRYSDEDSEEFEDRFSKSGNQPKIVGDQTLVRLSQPEPSLNPPEEFKTVDSTFDLNTDSLTQNQNSYETSSPPPSEMPNLGSSEEIDITHTGIDIESDWEPSQPTEGISAEHPSLKGLSETEMQKLLEEQLRVTLSKMAKDMLPDIAERIIKSEINKLLSNPPK